jgi:hypothetical protein
MLDLPCTRTSYTEVEKGGPLLQGSWSGETELLPQESGSGEADHLL